MPTALCENCKCVFNDDSLTECPNCDSRSYDYPNEDLSYCPNKKCDYYLIGQDTTSPHCQYCSTDSSKTRLLDADGLDTLIVEPEKTLTKGDRQLKAVLQQAESFISSSGSHHRSKGGSHTSSATEKHSGAMKGKKNVRTKYIERLQEAISKATDKSLKEEGEKMIKSMENK
ncbi:MAG TPA: hypothetical protein VKY19_00900 [Ktedonosporobacter sp.]|jgi:hypothetical protein|nr:hypothetical protein [Ktedonosporobacter sp.]